MPLGCCSRSLPPAKSQSHSLFLLLTPLPVPEKEKTPLSIATLGSLPFSTVISNFGDDKVTVLESEKRAWENSPEAQAIREALNPRRHHAAEGTKKS